MNKNTILNFAFIQISSNRSKYFPIFFISTFLIFILSCFIFISTSLKNDILLSLKNQADLTIQKIRSGKVVDAPIEWIDEFGEINGVKFASQRVYGRYYYEPAEEYFTIVGVDFFDKQINNNLKKVIKNIDMEKFLSKEYMLIGQGVKKFLDEYHFFKYYNFRPPNKSIEKVFIYDSFPKDLNIISSDMIIMDINLAKKILGIDDDMVTDVIVDVANEDELQTIITKIRIAHFDIRVLTKEDIYKGYINFFNYRSSLFIMLYFISFITLIIIIYQRYSLVTNIEKKEIGILRSLGWSITKILNLKILENMIVFISSFLVGINLAYLFVFVFDAPILNKIFLGFNNLQTEISFTAVIDFSVFIMLFLIFIIPLLASVLIPTWKISLSEPYEVMR